jgi:hypothetical protein
MSEVRLPGDLRHYLPLFFLAPSMGLLIYAWNKQPPPPPTVIVEIRSNGFEFPRDVQLFLRVGQKGRVAVSNGVAAVPFGPAGPVTVQLVVERGAVRSELVGLPSTFHFPEEPTETRWILDLTKTDCRAALKKLRAVR